MLGAFKQWFEFLLCTKRPLGKYCMYFPINTKEKGDGATWIHSSHVQNTEFTHHPLQIAEYGLFCVKIED